MGSRSRLAALAVAIVAFALPAAASAGVASPQFQPIGSVPIQVPLTVVIDPVNGSQMYAITDLPPPSVQVWNIDKDMNLTPAPPIVLPAGTTPIGLWFDRDGYLHIYTRELQSFTYCPDCHDLQRSEDFNPDIDYPDQAAAGWSVDMLTDPPGGSVWSGANGIFNTELETPGHYPEPIDFAADAGKLVGGRASGEFLAGDGTQNQVIEFGDAGTPAVIGTFPGPPGLGVGGVHGIAVDPLNLAPSFSGPATRPLFVSDSGEDGAIWWTGDWTTRKGAAWQEVNETPLKFPVVLDATCDLVAATSYAEDLIYLFLQIRPKMASCDNIATIKDKAKVKRVTITAKIKAYLNASGDAKVKVPLPTDGHKRAKSATAKHKAKLVAGRVSKLKLKLSGSGAKAVNRALAHHGKLRGTLKLKLHNAASAHFKVVQKLALK